jgi:hypothetical protein
MNTLRLQEVCAATENWWGISQIDLERLAVALLGRRKTGSWLRHGTERAIIAGKKFGAIATTLQGEIAAVNRDARSILAEGRQESALQAAAFYHVRFENIHPLHDGNGRTGRTIMTGQLYQSMRCSPVWFERILLGRGADYKAAFRAANSHETYRLLLNLLGHLFQIPISEPNLAAHYSLEPLHRSSGMPTPKPRPHVSNGLGSLVLR